VPKSNANLTRYHGVFAPNSPFRRAVVPGSAQRVRDKRKNSTTSALAEPADDQAPPSAPLTWAERLNRVFDIDISVIRSVAVFGMPVGTPTENSMWQSPVWTSDFNRKIWQG
jgi:hypothetical protein